MQEVSWAGYLIILFMCTLLSRIRRSTHSNSAPQWAILDSLLQVPASQSRRTMPSHSSLVERPTTTAGCTRIPDSHMQLQYTTKEEHTGLLASQAQVCCTGSLCTAMGAALWTPAFPVCQEDPLQQACCSRTAHHPRCRLSQRLTMATLRCLLFRQIPSPEFYVSIVLCIRDVDQFGAPKLLHTFWESLK